MNRYRQVGQVPHFPVRVGPGQVRAGGPPGEERSGRGEGALDENRHLDSPLRGSVTATGTSSERAEICTSGATGPQRLSQTGSLDKREAGRAALPPTLATRGDSDRQSSP
jgi:hypothetical protein